MTYFRRVGDTESPIEDRLTDEDESVIDLTGATVEFTMWEQGKSDAPVVTEDTTGVDPPVSITDPATEGLVAYDFQSGDLSTAGSYRYKWKVTFADGGTETWPSHTDGAPLKVLE